MDFGAILVSKPEMARANSVFAQINAFSSSVNAPSISRNVLNGQKGN